MGEVRLWKVREIVWLKEHYPNYSLGTCAILLKRSEYSVKAKVTELKLKHSPEFMSKRRSATQFKKGHTTLKGKKWDDMYSPEVKERLLEQRKNQTRHKIGEIYFVKSKGRKFIYLGKEKGSIPYARYIWETANGKIPKGCSISFKDGNPLNVELSNLECLTKAQMIEKNSWLNNKTKEQIREARIKGHVTRKQKKEEERLRMMPFLRGLQ